MNQADPKSPLNFLLSARLLIAFCFGFATSIYAAENTVPLPFQNDTPNSPYTINYDDLDILLNTSVVVTGRSTREKAKKNKASTGTRLKNRSRLLTSRESNRFWFEAFKKDDTRKLLSEIRDSLASLPDEAALKYFSKKEQLAYWLNLYNITVINEIAKVYPKTSLEDLIDDDDSIFEQKLLTVAGVPLSLNDIQHKILKPKYNNDPLIIYGLYQGNIGSPNIRNHAYTGKNVYFSLTDNAEEFINSNRGTYSNSDKYFRVSSYYARNKQYFPYFDKDLKRHLMLYINNDLSTNLENSTRIEANINDWNITDIYGSARNYGAGLATNSAALLDSAERPAIKGQVRHFDGVDSSIRNFTGDRAGGEAGNAGYNSQNLGTLSESFAALSKNYGRFSREQAERLKAMMLNKVDRTETVIISQDLNIEPDEEKK